VTDELAAALMRELAAALPEPLTPELVEVIGRLVTALSRGPNERERASDGELLTVPEVAARLRVSPKWVYAHQHELGSIRLGDGPKARLRFDPRAINAQLTLNDTTAEPIETAAPVDDPRLLSRPRRRRLASRPLPPSVRSHSQA